MTFYFDDVLHQTLELRHAPGQDEAYLTAIAQIEEPIVRDVLLCTGDREFPDDLRHHALKIIARCAIFQSVKAAEPSQEAREYVLTMHYSPTIEALHSLFHTLARRNIMTRFGQWTDSPSESLNARRRHDEALP